MRCCTAWSWRSPQHTCRRNTPSTPSYSPSCCWRSCSRSDRTASTGRKHDRLAAVTAQPGCARRGGRTVAGAPARERLLRVLRDDPDAQPRAGSRNDHLPIGLWRHGFAGPAVVRWSRWVHGRQRRRRGGVARAQTGLEPVGRGVVRTRCHGGAGALARSAVGTDQRDLLPHADADLRGHRLLLLRAGHHVLRLRRDHRDPPSGLLRRPS